MRQMTEIRWHARAGQGAVTAAKLVAETALELDRYMQAMPEYGPERMGAPIQAFTRISDEPIEIHNNIETPDVVVVLDESLLTVVDVTSGLASDGFVIVNTCSPPAQVRSVLKLSGSQTAAAIDASGIAHDTLGRELPNTPMIGALAQVTGLFTIDQIRDHLATMFGKKFSQGVVDANLAAVTRAYEEVQTT